MDLPLLVFTWVYAVMILGRMPGTRLDRTGAALLGSIALVGGGALTSAAAWRCIDVGTLGLLFGLMLLSAQFRLSGAYARLTRALAARPTTPSRLLLELVVTAGGLAALLTNDVVCVAMAPVLIDICVRRGLDPVPFLLGLAAAANVGSAATLIGNPQNMLLGQGLEMSFVGYLADGLVPAGLGLFVVWWLLRTAYHDRFWRALPPVAIGDEPFDGWQTSKGILLLAALVTGLLVLPWPHEVPALLAGGAVLLSRRHRTRTLLERVDWQLLLLFAGLFMVNGALQAAGHASRGFAWLREQGLDADDPATLFLTAVVGSNVVSNVPLTMLLVPVVSHPLAGPILALATTLAGNLLLVGSIANLIVVEQATQLGVLPADRSWGREHWRTGVPITLATLAIAAGWLWLRH